MRFRIAAIAAICLCAPAAPSRAGTYAITFDALAADAGRVVVANYLTPDGFDVQATNMLVADVGGVVGLEGVPGLDSLIAIQYGSGGQDGAYYGLDSASATFAAGPGDAIGWSGVLGIYQDGPAWDWAGTAPATMAESFPPGTYTQRILLRPRGDDPGRITGLVLDATPPPASVPEPPGLLTGAIGIGTAVALSRRLRASAA